MGVKQCAECGENVDEAKAFCPSCGNAFVEEEKRAEPSNFEKLDGTMQFGQTMYNEMLSDMGLNLKASPPPKRTVQSLKPVVESIKPIAATPSAERQVRTEIPPTQEDPKSRRKLMIISLIAAFLLLLLVVVVLVAVAVWWRFG